MPKITKRTALNLASQATSPIIREETDGRLYERPIELDAMKEELQEYTHWHSHQIDNQVWINATNGLCYTFTV